MKPSTRLSTFASLSICVIPSLVAAHLHLPFTRQLRDLSNTILSRDSYPSLSLSGGDYVFVVNATVGTPGQAVSLVISPSSADTWVPDRDSSYCNHTDYNYNYSSDTYDYDDYDDYNITYSSFCQWGSYDNLASSTYQRAQSGYRSWTSYQPDGAYMSGSNITDTLKIGDVTLDDLPMGLADTSDQWIGALGLGLNSSYYGGTYDNFPDRLVQAGTIKSKAYSIWLDAEDGSSGNLLMGAVDTTRYEGTLTRIDASMSGWGSVFYNSFGVTVQGINVTTKYSTPANATVIGSMELPFGATIGHGETFSNLPDAIAKRFWTMAGASYNSSIRLATIPCDAATTGDAKNVDTRFSLQLTGPQGPVLQVSLADLILPQTVAASMWNNYSPSTPPPLNRCLFAVQNGSQWNTYDSDSDSSSSYEYYSIAAPLLRRSYMVFDLENREIAVAPVKFGVAASNIVPFASYGAFIPSSTTYCISLCRGASNATDADDPNGTATGGGTGSSSSSGSGVRNIGLIVGLSVAFGLVTIVALVGGFLVWRKLASKKTGTGNESDAELADDGGSVPTATDQAPPVGGSGRGFRGPSGAALPTVREEMAEAPRDQGPSQLAPLPSVAPDLAETPRDQGPPQLGPLPSEEQGRALGHEEGRGATQWPFQGSPSPGETVSTQASDMQQHEGAAGESQPPAIAPVDKGKGKEVATSAHEDH